jgi:hypothetical protein
MAFNLRTLVREICDSSETTEPAGLTTEVLARIDEADLAEALRQALPTVVYNVISTSRMRTPAYMTTANTGKPEAGTATTAPRSTKVDGIREMWRSRLHDRYPVANGEWRFLRDLTTDDLDYAAGIRDDQARRNAAAADKLRRFAKLIVEHEVTKVGDLPEDVLRDQLDGRDS